MKAQECACPLYCGEGDHVHCFVTAPPKLSITAIVKYL
ncbi:transposase, partial [Hominisplanchenecus faecis]